MEVLACFRPGFFLESTALPSEISYAFILYSHQLKTHSIRIFTIRTFKPRLQFLAVSDENKTEHNQQTYTTQKERDKQDCHDVICVRQTSGPSACVRVELILDKL